MKEVTGNIIGVAESGGYDVVIQNCNCQNTMGAGVAKSIADSWPEVVEADNSTMKGDINKLGKYTKAIVVRGNAVFTVYNLYCQFRYGPAHERNFDYIALDKALHRLSIDLGNKKQSILFPLIGTGHAGGRWRRIKPAIEKYLGHHDLTLVRMP